MSIAQQLVDKMTGRIHKANPITYAHDLAPEFDLKLKHKVYAFDFPDSSRAYLTKCGLVWIGETLYG